VFFLGVISTGRYSDSQQVVLPKGSPKKAVGHTLTYTGSEQLPDGKFAYRVHVEGDGRNFELSPVMFRAGEQGVMRNPDIKSFLTRDIYLSPVSVQESQTAGEAESFTITKGSSVHVRDASVVFTRFDMSQHGSAGMAPGRIAIGAVLDISKGDERETITPLLIHVPNSAPEFTDATSRLLGVPVRLVAMNAGMAGQQSSVVVGIGTPGTGGASAETLIVEASVKPLVNFLWTGILIMMVGFVLAILKRSKES
jgi:cytochrome c-type biogenesis protein CcmF